MMEDFSGLALPPLFGGHILEAELEPGGVELGPGEQPKLCQLLRLKHGMTQKNQRQNRNRKFFAGGARPGGNELLENTEQEDEERRALDKRKYLALNRRCKEIEQVNQKILGRLHQVQIITRRLKKERRFLMKTLDGHGDDYRNAQLTILLEDESGAHLDPASGVEDERLNGVSGPTLSGVLHHAAGPKKKRHRIPRPEKDKDQQTETDMSVLTDTQYGEMPSPTSLSH